MNRDRSHDNDVVLIVEDDSATADALADLVTLAGYGAITAANGSEALGVLTSRTGHVCLIVLDLMMPVMDGWELRKRLLDDTTLSAIPVVVVTADANARRRSRDVQAVQFLIKPVEPTLLLETIGRYC